MAGNLILSTASNRRIVFPRRFADRGPGVGSLGDAPGSTAITATGVGELNAGLIAAQVQARTGMATTAEDIITRSIAHRIFDERGGTNARDMAIMAMATGVVGASSVSEAVSALRPVLEPLYRTYGPSAANEKLLQVFAAVSGTGADTALAGAAVDLAHVVLDSDTIQGLIRTVGDLLGNSGWLNDVASAIGDAASAIASFMPYFAAIAKFQLSMADYVSGLWGPIHGATVSAGQAEWATYGAQLYARLATDMGHDVGDPTSWAGSWSPFFYENFVYNTTLESLDFVRAMDVHQFRLSGRGSIPRWREVMCSLSALEFARSNPVGFPLPPGLNAEVVAGCNDGGYAGLYAMIRPYRWYQNQAAFRSAVLASLFVNGQVCCIRGMGEWVRSCRGIAGGGEDDYFCYNDNSPFYALGYPFRSSSGKSWWATWGGSVGFDQKVYALPPSRFPNIPTSLRGNTGAIRSWANTELRRRELWVPLEELLSGHPDLPREGTAGVSTRISRVTVQPVISTQASKKKKADDGLTTGETVAVVGVGAALVAVATKLLNLW